MASTWTIWSFTMFVWGVLTWRHADSSFLAPLTTNRHEPLKNQTLFIACEQNGWQIFLFQELSYSFICSTFNSYLKQFPSSILSASWRSRPKRSFPDSSPHVYVFERTKYNKVLKLQHYWPIRVIDKENPAPEPPCLRSALVECATKSKTAFQTAGAPEIWISHFPVVFYFCFIKSTGAQPFTWLARRWSCKKNSFQ